MPTNVGFDYQRAEEEYRKARSSAEKLQCLQRMLRVVPKHKGTEVLQKQIKERIAKIKQQEQKQKSLKKSGYSLTVKREGAAQICIVGPTNSGKSTLLHALTGAQVVIADYPFTTKQPEVGIMDYYGVKIQVIEIPAVTKKFLATTMGPTYVGILDQTDLLVLLFDTPEEKTLLDRELHTVNTARLVYNKQEKQAFARLIWKKLGLIKVYTKQRGKKKDHPPVAFKKGATVREVAAKVHKDFLQRFKYAKVYGKSAKFAGQTVGLEHVLADDDVVELSLS